MIKVSLIGSGNVAFQLAKQLSKVGALCEIRSRNSVSGKELAETYDIPFHNDLSGVDKTTDVVIIAVSDSAIVKVAEQLKVNDVIVAHTAGFQSMELLAEVSKNYGSFYPLQTFTKDKEVEFEEVPILIDGSNEKVRETLTKLANQLSNNVQDLPNAKRSELHVGAVVANNFTNHLLAVTIDYCEQNDLDFNLLKPLILETFEKALNNSPKAIQTGPARRGDQATIDKHLALLKDPFIKEIVFSLYSIN